VLLCYPWQLTWLLFRALWFTPSRVLGSTVASGTCMCPPEHNGPMLGHQLVPVLLYGCGMTSYSLCCNRWNSIRV
jgi:hypothetical protein